MNYQECSDEILVDMFRMDDQIAIEVLFDRYKNIVRRKAKAMFLAGGDSDDLIQEGMIGLYKAVRDYDETKEASFSTFASMCINRQIISAVTASNRKKNVPLNTYVSYDLPAIMDEEYEIRLVDVLPSETELNPEQMYIDREDVKQKREKLVKILSKMEKQVFELYMQEKDYREIAVILGKTPKAIDNALQRIRIKAENELTK
ncbi:MAG: RNA polymerase factor sigma-70 [Lachnospira sp.]|nr:RNA polymerase factor sigma-70 [Lachnospira sp.]